MLLLYRKRTIQTVFFAIFEAIFIFETLCETFFSSVMYVSYIDRYIVFLRL